MIAPPDPWYFPTPLIVVLSVTTAIVLLFLIFSVVY